MPSVKMWKCENPCKKLISKDSSFFHHQHSHSHSLNRLHKHSFFITFSNGNNASNLNIFGLETVEKKDAWKWENSRAPAFSLFPTCYNISWRNFRNYGYKRMLLNNLNAIGWSHLHQFLAFQLNFVLFCSNEKRRAQIANGN